MTKKEMTLNGKGADKIANALVHYKLLEEQKKEIELRQAKLKEIIKKYMEKKNIDEFISSNVKVFFMHKRIYDFDVPEIVKRVPEAIKYCKLTNEAFEKLLIGNEDKIGTLRKLVSESKSLTIKLIEQS